MILPTIPIQTTNQLITVQGKVFYNDRRRRLDVKKPIRDLFENNQLNVFYTMELCLSENKALERIKQLFHNKIMPVILYFNVAEDPSCTIDVQNAEATN